MRQDRQNPNARNFGLRSRDMAKAGLNALKEEMKSYSSIYTVSDRFNQFVKFSKEQLGIKDMRNLELIHVQQYARLLKSCVESGRYKAATAQNYLSAVNRVLQIARNDTRLHVQPSDAGIKRDSQVATTNKAQANDKAVLRALPDRFAVIYRLAQQFGLRFEEAAKLDAKAALSEARLSNQMTISRGVKGGNHDRILWGISGQQMRVLEQAAVIQGGGSSLIPSSQNYKNFRQEAQKFGVRYHAGRHQYAQERYRQLTGVVCPIVAGVRHGVTHHRYMAERLGISKDQARLLDHQARRVVSEELGHHRVDVTNNYLG